MDLKDFSLSNHKVLEKVHMETIKKLLILPKGEFLAKTYESLVVKSKVLRYGVLFPLFFKDWLCLNTSEKQRLFESIHIHSLCIYALILELDHFQDGNHKNALELPEEVLTIKVIQNLLEYNYKDNQSKLRTVWQNIILSDARKIFEIQKVSFGFETDKWLERFDKAVLTASKNFVEETVESKKSGRFEKKLAVAVNKNQMIIAMCSLLAPLATMNLSGPLFETSQKMMLPIQLTDDLFDWWEDYQEKKYTTLLRDVSSWNMTKEELYVYLVEQEYFQQILQKNILELSNLIHFLDPLGDKIIMKIFLSLRDEMSIKLEEVEKFHLFLKHKKKGGEKYES